MRRGDGSGNGAPVPHGHDVTDAHHHAAVTAGADRRLLATVLALLVAYMAAELVVAVFAHSLALVADAGHMLTDAGAIGASMWAMHLAARPSSPVWSYGLKRAEILAAAANGVTMLVVAVLLAAEAVRRLAHPHHVHAAPGPTAARSTSRVPSSTSSPTSTVSSGPPLPPSSSWRAAGNAPTPSHRSSSSR